MRIYVDSREVSIATPLFEGESIFVAIDSSKRNSAFAVGNLSRKVLHYVEFDGKDDGTSERDTLVLCLKQRQALSKLFQGANVKVVGIEDIVTKHKVGTRDGMTEHTSRFKITAVFMSFISFFQDTFGITPELVNNWLWKSTVLPEEFRKDTYKKGSLAYFKAIDSIYQNCSDDVTDALCILEFLYREHHIENIQEIKEPEIKTCDYDIFLVPSDKQFKHKVVVYRFNPSLALEQNATVMCNGIKENEIAVARVGIQSLSLREIYTFCRGRFAAKTEELLLVVQRR